jgi:6-phosphogluconolactonase/glucosamine-6-phosphate isomerase/deaminase
MPRTGRPVGRPRVYAEEVRVQLTTPQVRHLEVLMVATGATKADVLRDIVERDMARMAEEEIADAG